MGLKVDEVASRAGVGLQTVRMYERKGLLPVSSRLTSGYRTFPDSAVLRVRFIKRAQELGFSLAEVRDLLSLSGKISCQHVRACTKAKIDDVDEKIRTLQFIKDALAEMADRCPGRGPLSGCPILDALEAKGVLE